MGFILWVKFSRENIAGAGSLDSTFHMEEDLVLKKKKKSSKVTKNLHWSYEAKASDLRILKQNRDWEQAERGRIRS